MATAAWAARLKAVHTGPLSGKPSQNLAEDIEKREKEKKKVKQACQRRDLGDIATLLWTNTQQPGRPPRKSAFQRMLIANSCQRSIHPVIISGRSQVGPGIGLMNLCIHRVVLSHFVEATVGPSSQFLFPSEICPEAIRETEQKRGPQQRRDPKGLRAEVSEREPGSCLLDVHPRVSQLCRTEGGIAGKVDPATVLDSKHGEEPCKPGSGGRDHRNTDGLSRP